MIARARFAVIRESQPPCYLPSPAEIRAARREKLAVGVLEFAAWFVVFGTAAWAWFTSTGATP